MPKAKSWELSGEFWEWVEPLLPKDQKLLPKGRRGRGRPSADLRSTFAGILYVLRTGCQWKAVPKVYGSGSTVHRHFLDWARTGVFAKLWLAGLAEYDEMEGIAWKWQSIDGAMVKAPLGGEATGPNPTDRGKSRNEAPPPRRRSWSPAVPRRDRS
jgi:transposase